MGVPAARLGLDRKNAEVFFGGKNKGFGPLQVIAEHFKWLITHDRHVGSRFGANLGHLRTIADDYQLFIRHRDKSFNNQIHSLVRHHS